MSQYIHGKGLVEQGNEKRHKRLQTSKIAAADIYNERRRYAAKFLINEEKVDMKTTTR